MKIEHATTYGAIRYDERGNFPEGDPPVPESPPGDGWQLVCATTGPLRFSQMAVFWFWRREVTE